METGKVLTQRAVFLRSLAVLTAAVLTLLFGCSDNGLDLAKVRGKVIYKGQPVKNGTVFFMPDETKGTVGPPAVGSITSDGSYIMSSSSSGDGVIVGSHKIGITGVEENPVEGATDAPTPESDPQGYMKAKAKGAAAARSGRAPKEVDTFTDRGGKKWRYVVPKRLTNPQESGIIAKVDPGSQTMNFEIDETGTVQITR
jgi:hypothetical protein